MKFIEFTDINSHHCYNASHIIRVAWEEGPNTIHIETINKGFTHIFDYVEAANVYFNHIMSNLVEEV